MAGRAAKSKAASKRRASVRLAAKLARDPDDIEALYEWFDALAAEQGDDRAAAALGRMANKTSSAAPALVLGYCLFGVGRPRDAVRAFELAYRRRPNEQTLYALSGAMLADDRVEEAIEVLKARDAKRPLATRPLVNLANAHAAKGDLKEARRALERTSPTGRKEWRQLVGSARERVVSAKAAGAAGDGPKTR